MKLLTKTLLYYALISIILFIPGGLIAYHAVRAEFRQEVDDGLLIRKEFVQGHLARLASVSPIGRQFQVEEIPIGLDSDSLHLSRTIIFADTQFQDSGDDEPVLFRQLSYVAVSEGRSYKVCLRQSLIESDDILDSMTLSIGILLGLLLGGMLLANLAISKSLWKPFHQTLAAVERYDWSKPGVLDLPKSSTQEFIILNRALLGMAGKIQDQIGSLREFTDNASHEMQTPLAIILGKLENLLDEGHLDARQAMEIQALHAAAGRLSRMNKALLLLARMEGDRFLEIVALDIGLEVKRILGEYAELMEMKSIGVRQSLSEPLPVSMNPELCAVLLANLIRNAMQHNVVGGNISIQGTPGQLIISNTGLPLTEPAERFFERFYKANQASDSLGLGLAVAKKICDLNGFVLEYSYQDSRHILTLRF